MSEIITEYFKGLSNYFKDFDKSKFYNILRIITLILILISFSVISIPCYICYRYGCYKTEKRFKDSLERKTPTILSGIHTDKPSELISISEVNLSNTIKK